MLKLTTDKHEAATAELLVLIYKHSLYWQVRDT